LELCWMEALRQGSSFQYLPGTSSGSWCKNDHTRDKPWQLKEPLMPGPDGAGLIPSTECELKEAKSVPSEHPLLKTNAEKLL
jgi:hypothetical protein